MLPHWFKEYLSFHRTERNGIIAVLLFILGLIAFNMYQRVFWKGDWQELYLKYGESMVEFKAKTDSVKNWDNDRQPWMPENRTLFQFDPNTLDSTGWVNLGFSPKQVASIIKYREAGAVFRKPEDIKKLFVVDEERYAELAPFIAIDPQINDKPTQPKFDRTKWEKPEPVLIRIELNSADSTELVQLKGIGSSFAKRIIKYRELLGGYISKDQVLEVYGMDSARYIPIELQLEVDTAIRQKMNLNEVEAKELMRHPYLDKNQAVAIVNYRKQHGPFKAISDLRKIHLVKEETYRKIAPYFKVP